MPMQGAHFNVFRENPNPSHMNTRIRTHMHTQHKFEKLKSILAEMGSAVVAYSGGADSTFLLKIAFDVLHDRVLAVTARSETYPENEIAGAEKVVRQIGAQHMTIETRELNDERYASNPPDRCYYCKKELFSKLVALAGEMKYSYVADGSNLDDDDDFRPGSRAIVELGIRSPLQEAGLHKNEIRELSREMGLVTWDKPAMPCLATRIPYGTRITRERLVMIKKAERCLFELGFSNFRVRYHGDVARIELLQNDMPRILAADISEKIISRFKELGFTFIALDMQGYRMGSMNELLPNKSIRGEQ